MYPDAKSRENLEREEEIALAIKWRDHRDEKARLKILAAYDKKACSYAQKAKRRGLDPEDLLQSARIGLSKALDQFDPEMGNRFGTFAHYYILSEIQLYTLEQGSSVRIFNTTASKTLLSSYPRLSRKYENPNTGKLDEEGRKKICQEIGIQMEELLRFEQVKAPTININVGAGAHEDDIQHTLIDDNNPEENALKNKSQDEAHTALENALAELDARDAKIIFMRYFKEPPLTLESIGEKLNISRERVRQLEIRSIKNLKTILQKHGIHHPEEFFNA